MASKRYPQFTDEHEMFRKAVRRFAEEELAPHADEWEDQREFPRDVFEQMGKLGFLGARYPEQIGGAGGDIWHTAVLAEELPHCRMGGLTMGILVHTDMATPIIQKIGTEEQKEEFLRPALSGDKVAALAISEPGAGSDVAGMRTTAQKDGDEYVISGQKTWITNGTRADFITLAARTDPDDRYGGISLFLFPTETEGFEVGKKLDKIGNHTSDTAELFFDDCRIPEKYLLGDEGAGFYYIMKNFQGERLTAALTALGSADIAIEETKAYCKDRQAFGKSISDMQVTQHRFADMETELQSARDLTYHAADLFDRGVDAQREISMAKLKAGETAKDVLDECLQLHGGMGYMEETPIARAWRDIRVLTIAGGTSAIMKEIIAKASGL